MDKMVGRLLAISIAPVVVTSAPAWAGDSFADVGKQQPITILISASPWYDGFQSVVGLYEKQTGNKVDLEVTPFPGMLAKARTAVRSAGKSPYDLINVNSPWTIEFYQGGFLEPLKEIDPAFEVPKEVYPFDDAGCWDAVKKFRTCKTGKLMGYAPNGNIEFVYYRKDMFDEKGLKPPITFDDVLANCRKLHSAPRAYGYLQRGDPVWYDWMAYMLGYGAKEVADAENGDFTVTIDSAEAKAALEKYIEVSRTCGPANYGSLAQGQLIQLVQTGKGMQAQAVIASFPNFDNPQKSAVVGKMEATMLPRVKPDGKPGVAIGSWVLGVPRNASDEGKKGAIAFSKWFLTYKAQYAYAEAGAIPVREDVFASDLKDKSKFRWMKAYGEEIPYGKQLFGYAESAEITDALNTRLSQALVGELSPAQALNKAAADFYGIFTKSGRKTGKLEPLPE
jgi:multiple sugar transport system substrate-binding protein